MKGSDPLTNTAGVVALVVAANQPFYPLFLHAVVGGPAWPAWLTLLSTPFFAAVPSVARRHFLAGRALLPLVGTANTVLSVKLFGVESAAQLFLLPCVLLGSILFRPGERAIMAMVLSIIFLAYVSLGENLGSALNVFSAAEYKSMVALHAVSVAALTAFIGLLFSSILASREVGTNRQC